MSQQLPLFTDEELGGATPTHAPADHSPASAPPERAIQEMVDLLDTLRTRALAGEFSALAVASVDTRQVPECHVAAYASTSSVLGAAGLLHAHIARVILDAYHQREATAE